MRKNGIIDNEITEIMSYVPAIAPVARSSDLQNPFILLSLAINDNGKQNGRYLTATND